MFAISTGLALYVTHRIKDPIERQLALDHFLDVEGHKKARAEMRNKEKPKLT